MKFWWLKFSKKPTKNWKISQLASKKWLKKIKELCYSVSHNSIHPPDFSGNHGNHQNFVPSLVPHNLWLIWIGMKQKNAFLPLFWAYGIFDSPKSVLLLTVYNLQTDINCV